MYLMLADEPVMRIDITRGIFDVLRPEKLPFPLRNTILTMPEDNMQQYKIAFAKNYGTVTEFLASRILNLDRKNAKKILNSYNFSQSQDALTKTKIAIACKAVSMIDSYWLNDDEMSLQWKDINVRKNSLSDIIAHIALTGSSLTATGLPHTPELTGQGIYAKAWYREGDKILLYKASTKGGHESRIEESVSRILDCFEIDHVKYEVSTFENLEITKCENMSSEDLCIVPAQDFYTYCNRNNLDFLSETKKIDKERLYQMCVIDYLISNSDRHGLNWGFYMDNSNGNLVSLHPLYDHNNAFDEKDINDAYGGKSLIFSGKTKREAALHCISECNIKCIKPITRDMFVKQSHYDSFMQRASELELYKKQKRTLWNFFARKELYVPVKLEPAMPNSQVRNKGLLLEQEKTKECKNILRDSLIVQEKEPGKSFFREALDNNITTEIENKELEYLRTLAESLYVKNKSCGFVTDIEEFAAIYTERAKELGVNTVIAEMKDELKILDNKEVQSEMRRESEILI